MSDNLIRMAARSYAIIGAGALGGYFGARLHHAGLDMHFLLHSDYEHVRAHGLRVESKDGDLSIARPHAYGRAEDMPRCDVVMVCLKATHNHLLPELLPPVVKGGGAVLVMQNGLGVEREAAAALAGLPGGWAEEGVLGGMAFLCSHKVGPGHIRHMDYGGIRLGAYDPDDRPRGVTPLMSAIAADLGRAGVPVDLEDDLVLARWKKLVWNVPFNGLTVVLDATTDRLMAHRHTRALCEALMREVALDAAACGRKIEGRFIAGMMRDTDRMVSYRPSMKMDYDHGRPMEVEPIYGDTLRAAKAAGVESPRIEQLYRQLKFLDDHNRREQGRS